MGGSKEWLMRHSEKWKHVSQQLTQTPKFFPDNLIPGILQHLLKAPLECMTESLTYRSGRCLQIALPRLEKGIRKTQELGRQLSKLGLCALCSNSIKTTRARNEFFLYKVTCIPPQENQTLCLTPHCSQRLLAESHIAYLFFFFDT